MRRNQTQSQRYDEFLEKRNMTCTHTAYTICTTRKEKKIECIQCDTINHHRCGCVIWIGV